MTDGQVESSTMIKETAFLEIVQKSYLHRNRSGYNLIDSSNIMEHIINTTCTFVSFTKTILCW